MFQKLGALFIGLLTCSALFVACTTTPVKPKIQGFVEISYCGLPAAVYVIDSLGQTHLIDLGSKDGHDNADKLLDGVVGDSYDICPPDGKSSL